MYKFILFYLTFILSIGCAGAQSSPIYSCRPIEASGGGTGVADNTAALTAALAPATGNICVSFGPGVYNFASQISKTLSATGQQSLTLMGQGSHTTTLNWTGNTGGLNIVQGAVSDSVHIRSLALTTQAANAGDALDLSTNATLSVNAQNDLTDVWISGYDGLNNTGRSNYWTYGINIHNLSFVNFNNVNIWGGLSSGSTRGVGVILSGSNTSNLADIVFNFNGCYFQSLVVGLLYSSYTQGVTVTQSNFTGVGTGILTQGTALTEVQLTVSDSQFDTSADGIFIGSDIADVVLHNNLIFVASGQAGIAVTAGQRMSFVGNDIFCTSNAASFGFDFAGTDSTNSAIVTGNTIQNCGTAISLGSGSFNFNVQSNSYRGNTVNTVNAGTGNTVGGGSP